MANSASTANIFAHPVHPMLIPGTIAFFVVAMWRSGKAGIPFASPPQFGSSAQVSLWPNAMRYGGIESWNLVSPAAPTQGDARALRADGAELRRSPPPDR